MKEKEIERMLRPRYEVIADYPNSPYKVGDIIEKVAQINWQVKQRPVSRISSDDSYKEYPHLFRELKWWEKREASEMPKYVKLNPETTIGGDIVLEVEKWVQVGEEHCAKGRSIPPAMYSRHFLPATEAEYEKGKTKN